MRISSAATEYLLLSLLHLFNCYVSESFGLVRTIRRKQISMKTLLFIIKLFLIKKCVNSIDDFDRSNFKFAVDNR